MSRIYFKLLILTLLGLSGCVPLSENPLVARDGQTITFKIDAQITAPIPEPKAQKFKFMFNASQGRGIAKAVSGNPSFEFDYNRELLGEFKQADLQIIEVKSEYNEDRWPSYACALNSSSAASAAFKPNSTSTPKEYWQADSKRLKRLPAGVYLVRLQVFGTKNWDRQSVMMIVKS